MTISLEEHVARAIASDDGLIWRHLNCSHAVYLSRASAAIAAVREYAAELETARGAVLTQPQPPNS